MDATGMLTGMLSCSIKFVQFVQLKLSAKNPKQINRYWDEIAQAVQ